MREKELEAARIQRATEKRGGPKMKIEQPWRGKKSRAEKIKRGEHARSLDAWRYVKHVAAPLMWIVAVKSDLKAEVAGETPAPCCQNQRSDLIAVFYSHLSKVLVIHFLAGVATTILITKIAVTQQQQHLCNKE